MSRRNPLRLRIASPCKADWEAMRGDDAVRHCGACDKHVYNLSEMTTGQVEALLRDGGETPCVRFYQRHDGTVMTGDCPVGAGARGRKRTVAGLGAAALAALGLAVAPSVAGGGDDPLGGARPAPESTREIVLGGGGDDPLGGARPAPESTREIVLGEVAVEPLAEPSAEPAQGQVLKGRMVPAEPVDAGDSER